MINVVCINMFILFINYNYFQSNPSAGLWSMAGLLVQQSLTNHFFGVLTNQFYGNKMMQNNTIITKGTLWYLYCNIQYRYNCIGRSRLHHREAIHSAEVEHKRLARGLWNHDNFCQINDSPYMPIKPIISTHSRLGFVQTWGRSTPKRQKCCGQNEQKKTGSFGRG